MDRGAWGVRVQSLTDRLARARGALRWESVSHRQTDTGGLSFWFGDETALSGLFRSATFRARCDLRFGGRRGLPMVLGLFLGLEVGGRGWPGEEGGLGMRQVASLGCGVRNRRRVRVGG